MPPEDEDEADLFGAAAEDNDRFALIDLTSAEVAALAKAGRANRLLVGKFLEPKPAAAVPSPEAMAELASLINKGMANRGKPIGVEVFPHKDEQWVRIQMAAERIKRPKVEGDHPDVTLKQDFKEFLGVLGINYQNVSGHFEVVMNIIDLPQAVATLKEHLHPSAPQPR
jgi:hypothetical protein